MKSYRLNRLFNGKSGNCFDVAIDHGFFNEYPFLSGIENIKKAVDVFAPGLSIHCDIAGNGTQMADGTSMASPVVAGISALLRSYFPKLKAVEIVDIIKRSGTDVKEKVIKPGTKDEMVNFSELCNTGKIVNAANAIQMAIEISSKK